MTTAATEAEIQRTKKIIRELDQLDAALEETNLLFEHIKKLRRKCDSMGGRFDRLTAQQQVTVRPDTRRR